MLTRLEYIPQTRTSLPRVFRKRWYNRVAKVSSVSGFSTFCNPPSPPFVLPLFPLSVGWYILRISSPKEVAFVPLPPSYSWILLKIFLFVSIFFLFCLFLIYIHFFPLVSFISHDIFTESRPLLSKLIQAYFRRNTTTNMIHSLTNENIIDGSKHEEKNKSRFWNNSTKFTNW